MSPRSQVDFNVLRSIERRILWLAVRIVDHANRGPDAGGIKVGGHQASSASMVSIMTALWFAHLGGEDKVAVKPHASPVFHAIKYLTGELDGSYLTQLRRFGGLQAYPSRTKDPDVADFSTGSVGLGAVAPLFSAAARRYVDAHFGERPPARFVATVGDAELDEGNVWEAIADPAMQGLGNVMLIVDLNRQSLDRVVPAIQATRLQRFFADAGWHVAEAKYGELLQAAFARKGGDALKAHLDAMTNEAYQQLFSWRGAELRERFLAGADKAVAKTLADIPDEALAGVLFNLGGHDLEMLLRTYQECDAQTERPSVVFAYTVKGWGLPIAGDPLNHSALLSEAQVDELRAEMGLTADDEWSRFPDGSPEAEVCERVGGELNNLPPKPRPDLGVPVSAGRLPVAKPTSSQEAFGRVLTMLAAVDGVGERIVTTSPDVSISTNLGGWINKVGVFAPEELPDHGGADRLLKWSPKPSGRHIELGISEMNLFLMLGQLGLTHEHHGEMLLPVGTVYDPFVLRGLDAFVYSVYNGAKFVVAGTPAGVTLAPEGGAHQSTITPSVGIELPGVDFAEPAFAREVDWLLCDGLAALSSPDAQSLYLRMSTRPIDQAVFEALVEERGEEPLRREVLAGGYVLREPSAEAAGGEPVTIVASGAIMPEALAAAEQLEDEGVAPSVVNVTSADRLYRGWQQGCRGAVRSASGTPVRCHLDDLFSGPRASAPVVSVIDGASHTMAWIGAALGVRQVPLGVDEFGQSGSIPELHAHTGIDTDHIVNAALLTLS